MRKSLVVCFVLGLGAACIAVPAAQARSFDDMIEPAMMMKLDFGGSSRPDFGVGLRLNYSTAVRQALGAMSATPNTSMEALESGIGSRLFETPALAQLDFNRNGFRRASLVGLPFVTRHVRLNQTEEGVVEETPAEEGAMEEAPVEEGAMEEAAAEEWVWYDYTQWGWRSWSLAAAGAVGAYLLVDSGSDDPAPAAGGGGVPCDVPPIGPIPGEPAGCDPSL